MRERLLWSYSHQLIIRTRVILFSISCTGVESTNRNCLSLLCRHLTSFDLIYSRPRRFSSALSHFDRYIINSFSFLRFDIAPFQRFYVSERKKMKERKMEKKLKKGPRHIRRRKPDERGNGRKGRTGRTDGKDGRE